jgi:hypothetical protein
VEYIREELIKLNTASKLRDPSFKTGQAVCVKYGPREGEIGIVKIRYSDQTWYGIKFDDCDALLGYCHRELSLVSEDDS